MIHKQFLTWNMLVKFKNVENEKCHCRTWNMVRKLKKKKKKKNGK